MSLSNATESKMTFHDHTVRTIIAGDRIWFRVVDVTNIIEYKNCSTFLSRTVGNKNKATYKSLLNITSASTKGGGIQMWNKLNSVYINEAGFYALIMKSTKPVAKEFQTWVTDEVLPTIRQKGSFTLADNPNSTMIEMQNEIKRMQLALASAEEKAKKIENELKEAMASNMRLYDQTKELSAFKKKLTKNETIYIVTTEAYGPLGFFKIGKTKLAMKVRKAGHNNTRIGTDKVDVAAEFKVHDASIVEKLIHQKLSGALIPGEKEWFQAPFYALKKLVNDIIDGDGNLDEQANMIIDLVGRLHRATYRPLDWMEGLPEHLIKKYTRFTTSRTESDEKIDEADEASEAIKADEVEEYSETDEITEISEAGAVEITQDPLLLDDEGKKELLKKCLESYISDVELENDEHVEVVWPEFQKFFIECTKIVKSRFKALVWKTVLKEVAKDMEQIQVKYRTPKKVT